MQEKPWVAPLTNLQPSLSWDLTPHVKELFVFLCTSDSDFSLKCLNLAGKNLGLLLWDFKTWMARVAK